MAKNGVDANFSALTAWWDGFKYSNPAKRPALPAPVGFVVSVSGNTVSLTWTASGVSGVSVHIERSAVSNNNYQEIVIKSPGLTDHLDPGRAEITYYYRIRFRWGTLYSAYSDEEIAIVVGSGNSGLTDGQSYTLVVPGAGSNSHAVRQSFLGGANSPIEAAAYNTLFSAFMPANWAMPGAAGTRVRTERSLNGTKALCHDRTGGAYQFAFRYDHPEVTRTLFYRYSYYLENPNNVAGQLKQIRATPAYGSGFEDGNIANTYLTRNGSGTGIIVNNGSGATNLGFYPRLWDSGSSGSWHAEGTWVTVTAYVTCNSAVGVADGKWRVGVRRESDNTVIGNITMSNAGLWLRAEATPYSRQTFQFYMGNGYDQACKTYIDRDVYVMGSTTTACPKYLLIGNASTYAACTIFTIAPFSVWDDSVGGGAAAITFQLNRGRHLSLEGLYLYAMSDVETPLNSTGVLIEA